MESRKLFFDISDSSLQISIANFVAHQEERVRRRFTTKESWYEYLDTWCQWLFDALDDPIDFVSNDNASTPQLDTNVSLTNFEYDDDGDDTATVAERERVAQRERTITQLLNTMPDNWSDSEPLPVACMAFEGHAGTGKTYTVNTLSRRLGNFWVTGWSRAATDNFLRYAAQQTPEGAMAQIKYNKTLCSAFRIRYISTEVQVNLREAELSSELQHSMAALTGVHDVRVVSPSMKELTRRHLATAIVSLRPLLRGAWNEMLYGFHTSKAHSLRCHRGTFPTRASTNNKCPISSRVVLGDGRETFPEPQDELITPKHIRHYERLYGTLGPDDDLPEKLPTRYRDDWFLKGHMRPQRRYEDTLQENVYECARTCMELAQETQEGFNGRCAMLDRKSSDAVPLFVRQQIGVCEEDGMAHGLWCTLRKLIVLMGLFLYRPPMLCRSVPVITTSGSATQSNPINTCASALQVAACPIRLADRDNTLAVRSEFFRRSTTELDDPCQRMFRVATLGLEQNLSASEYTFSGLLPNEVHDEAVEDPNVAPEDVRFYESHYDVRRYCSKIDQQGLATVPVVDIVYLADLLVPVEGGRNRRIPIGAYDEPPQEHMSTLTSDMAAENRQKLWALKVKACYSGTTIDMDGLHWCSDTGTLPQEAREPPTKRHCGEWFVSEHGDFELRRRGKNQDLAATRNDLSYGKALNDASFFHICAPAALTMSREEHANKRRWAKFLETALGDGSAASKVYLTGSKAEDQTASYKYIPAMDLCLETADYHQPLTKLDAELADTIGDDGNETLDVKGRLLLMAFKRTRMLISGSAVGMQNRTKVEMTGVRCTFATVVNHSCFPTEGNDLNVFKTLVYSSAIMKYMGILLARHLYGSDHIHVDTDVLKMWNETNIQGPPSDLIEEFMSLITRSIVRRDSSDTHNARASAALGSGCDLNSNNLAENFSRILLGLVAASSDTTLVKTQTFDFLVTESPLYAIMKFSNEAVNLTDLCTSSTIDDIQVSEHQVSDNYTPTVPKNLIPASAYSAARTEARYTVEKEKHARFCDGIIKRTLEQYYRGTIEECRLTVIIGGELICRTTPIWSRSVSWRRLLHTGRKEKKHMTSDERDAKATGEAIGLATRMPLDGNPSAMRLAPRKIIPEMLNDHRYRRKRMRGNDNLWVKTKDKAISCIMNEDQESRTNIHKYNMRFQPLETYVAWGVLNSMYGQSACTIKFAQGSTLSGGARMNIKSLFKDYSTDMGDVLVGLTRNSQSSKAKIASLERLVWATNTKKVMDCTMRKRKELQARARHMFIKL